MPSKSLDVVPQLDSLVVHELYASVQGESSFAGLPCVFIRLTGCNLRCAWCDTPHAFTGGRRRLRADVVAEAVAFGLPLVELTGGEPLLQSASLPLMRDLCDAGCTVLLETSGERDVGEVDARVHKIVDFKAPGSGESSRNRWANVAHLTRRDEVKFVLADREDYEWAKKMLSLYDIQAQVSSVLFSGVHGVLDMRDLSQWLVEDRLSVRLQLQLHKHIWDPSTTGV